MSASKIWAYDESRVNEQTSHGYNVHIIWETDYRTGSWNSSLRGWLGKHEEKDDTDAFRSSVNDHSSADVKLGELLGSRGEDATTQLETVDVKAEKS